MGAAQQIWKEQVEEEHSPILRVMEVAQQVVVGVHSPSQKH